MSSESRELPGGELPAVLASSVIRSSHPGQSHGALYVVDLESGRFRRVLDWNRSDIRWDGRGGERGLRGVAVHDGAVFVASYDRMYEYDHSFALRRAYQSPYLRDCHEISPGPDSLFVASTGVDSVLEFDLDGRAFTRGYHVHYSDRRLLLNKAIKRTGLYGPRPRPRVRVFDARGPDGPPPGDRLHLNNAFHARERLFATGTQLGLAIDVSNGGHPLQKLPFGTHNARPYRSGMIANDTARDRIVFIEGGRVRRTWRIPRYDESELQNSHLPQDYARQAFGRGLCITDRGHIVAGSSPATISLYVWDRPEPVKTVQLSSDVRNAIHGLTVWPAGADA